MAERRKFIRFETLLDAFQLHDVILDQPERIKSRLKDISREGVRLLAKNVLSKGSSVGLEINIPGDNIPVFAFSKVMWTKKKDKAEYDAGLTFTQIKGDDKARLLDYAYEGWLKALRQKAKPA